MHKALHTEHCGNVLFVKCMEFTTIDWEVMGSHLVVNSCHAAIYAII